jgi:hypothetical protein
MAVKALFARADFTLTRATETRSMTTLPLLEKLPA